MARKLKIKRYHDGGGFYRARPHPVAVVLTLLAVGALVFLGVSIYGPVAEFLRELTSPTEPQLDLPPPPTEPATAAPTEPPAEPEPSYPAMRAVYLPAAVLADDERLAAAFESIKGSEINTVLVEIKDAAGNVLFNAKTPEAAEWGAVTESPLDLAAFSERLSEEGLALAVRLHTFQDQTAALANRENAIRYQELEWLWLDAAEQDGGRPWLNPYSEGAQQYITALCLEAADAGASFILLDSFQCPPGSVANANFGSRAGVVSRADILKGFEEELSEELSEKGARSALYLPAAALTATEAENETRYGGSPLLIAGDAVVPGALPYQFPAGFAYGGTTLDDPVSMPGTATEFTLSLFLDGNPLPENPPDYIPLLQGGSEPALNAAVYTPAEVAAQIAAVKARGIEEYILYVTDGNYAID